ncbi:MAG TPA: zinc ribbon domain-containing protein [Gemmatimonadales bacterium]|nr:zinc ribbon domain-containing protein [Gemmatimonadales bacterium]
MLLEAIAALVVGAAVLVLVLEPLIRPEAPAPAPADPEEAEESARGRAVAALREIEFDRATGKLSDLDYATLKNRYTATALEAMRAEQQNAPSANAAGGGAAPKGDIEAQVAARVLALRSAAAGGGSSCPTCGPRPETDAVYCSNCGRSLRAPDACARCRSPISTGSRFCESCGERVAA